MTTPGPEPLAEGRSVTLRLNQQQLELLDRAVAQGVAPSRDALVLLALRESAQPEEATQDG